MIYIFRFVGHIVSPLLVIVAEKQRETIYSYGNEWTWLCFNKTLFIESVRGSFLASKFCLLNSGLNGTKNQETGGCYGIPIRWYGWSQR